ncbi:spore germination protein KA [Paenibacillus intestini]|nr:spore germination protein KA [Paenibacillus intestini]
MTTKRHLRFFKKKMTTEIACEMGFNDENGKIQSNLNHTLQRINRKLGQSPDVITRAFQITDRNGVSRQVAAVYVEGLSNEEKINEFISYTMRLELQEIYHSSEGSQELHDLLHNRALAVGSVSVTNDWNDIMYGLLSGDVLILLDDCNQCLLGGVRGGEQRSVSPPETEVNIRGPKDSFTESIGTNVSLIRRRLKSPNLWMESLKIGNVSHTEVKMMYLKGVADDALVDELRRRLKDIRIDMILETGYIEELVEDETFTPFPTVYNSERPDIITGNLMEGRIAVLVDGTPNTLILPTTFSQFFKAAEDYYQRFDFPIFMRMIRYVSFFIVILLPSVYIALTAFHHEMIPTALAINLLSQREGVPFPVVLEALLMELAFEIMREAGTRMPRAVGQAVSIVGAVVLGQAAVQAGIVTAMMVIIVSLTGIASFTMPAFALTTTARIIRFPMMFVASTLGFYGIILAMIVLIAHMTSLRSLGIPYLSPFAPFGAGKQKDTIWRALFKSPKTRPDLKNSQNPPE